MCRTTIHNLERIETAKQQVYEIRSILVVLKASQGKFYTGRATNHLGPDTYFPQMDIKRIIDLMPSNYRYIRKPDRAVDHIRDYNEYLVKLIADESPYLFVKTSLYDFPAYDLKLFMKCVKYVLIRVMKDIKDGRWS